MTEIELKQEKPSSDELRQVLGKLSVDQIRFVVARQEHATDKEAAEAIGVKPQTVYQWSHKGVPIAEAVRLMAFDGLETALHIRHKNLTKAMLVKVAGLDEKDKRVRQAVATEIIEWEIGKATQRQELTGRDGGPIQTEDMGIDQAERDRSISALADAIANYVYRGGDSGDGAVDTAE